MKKLKIALLTAALATGTIGWAQPTGGSAAAATAPSSAKTALINQFIDLQRPGIEQLARDMVTQSSDPIAAAASDYLRTQVPADKRDAAAKAADTELKKYFDENYPLVRDRALQVAPATLTPVLDQTFSEDELRQLIQWISSPLSKKYMEANQQLGQALAAKVSGEMRPAIEPKLSALNVAVAKAVGAPTGGPAPKAPAKGSSKK